MTKDILWVEIANAMSVLEDGELIEFSELSDAEAFVAKTLSEGGHIQAMLEQDVPWDTPPIDYDAVQVDWESVKNIVQEVLERARTSEAIFKKDAIDLGVTYEDFLAAAITELISKEINSQLMG